MSLLRYGEYKDSGVEWLGQVPGHWKLARLKDIAEVVNGFPFDSKLFEADGAHALVRIRDLDARETATRYSGAFVPAAAVTPSDVLIGMDGDFNVGRWLGAEAALLNQRMCCVRTSNSAFSTFLRHALPIPLKAINEITYSTTVKHLSSLDVEKIRLALPDGDELTTIAAFLDRETAKIDALIAEQEKLIALLAEKRKATISHAVTKGLNPNAPMKDSGVTWLGKVPTHWDVLRIKRVVSSIEQGWSPQCENFPVNSPQEWGVLKVGCVNGGGFQPAENKKLPPELEPIPAYSVRRGDLLISRANTRDLVGSAAAIEEDFDNLMLCDKLYRVRLDEARCVPTYLAAYLGTPEARSQVELEATGASSSMLNIGQSAILDMFAPIPSIAEQKQIQQFLAEEARRLDALNDKAGEAINLLKERRRALVAAAVTGQIDVRNA